MKYMVVNEMTSSIGPSKNSVISMAVAAALTCTSAIAATITDVDGTFTALSDDATIIYGDRTVHSNSLYSAGYHFVTIPADPTNSIDVNIKIRNCKTDLQNTFEHLCIVEVKQDGNMHSPFKDYLQSERVKRKGISKYCLGMVLTDDSLKRNRFKRKISYIKKMLKVA